MCPRTCDRARSAYTLAARTHSNARARTHARRHACTHARTHALCGTECEALEWRGEYARLYCNSPLWPPLGRCCARRRCCTLCTSRDGSSSVRACGLRFPFASARWLRLPARSVGNKFRFSFGAFCWCLLYSMRGQEFRPQICGWLAGAIWRCLLLISCCLCACSALWLRWMLRIICFVNNHNRLDVLSSVFYRRDCYYSLCSGKTLLEHCLTL